MITHATPFSHIGDVDSNNFLRKLTPSLVLMLVQLRVQVEDLPDLRRNSLRGLLRTISGAPG